MYFSETFWFARFRSHNAMSNRVTIGMLATGSLLLTFLCMQNNENDIKGQGSSQESGHVLGRRGAVQGVHKQATRKRRMYAGTYSYTKYKKGCRSRLLPWHSPRSDATSSSEAVLSFFRHILNFS